MASVLNEESVEKKLRTVNNTQDSIQTLSLWIIHHKSNHAKIVELWMRVLRKTAQPSHRLTLFYLCNDVVQNCKKKKAFVYNTTFKEYLREAACLVRDQSVKNKVERIFNIWGERGVYDAAFIKSLYSVLNGQHVKSYKVHENMKEEAVNAAPAVRAVNTPQVDPEPKEAAVEQHTELDAEESARILADFKPHEMIDQITIFVRQEAEIKLKVSQLAHLRLDASNLEAVKQLKDRTHGSDFSNHFEDSFMKLEDLVKRQACRLNDQRALLETLTLSETFYEEQYREAKIVANAYKNFGARINNMKKKLDELKKSMPEEDSPIPSPDGEAPSPSNTPPHTSRSGYAYNPAAPMNYGQGLQQTSWMYNETGSMRGVTGLSSVTQDSNSFPGSPSLEAPSPEGSPPDLSLDGSENASGSLESRLASFFDRGRSDASNPPVYTPQLPHSATTGSRSKVGEDEGSITPLDDDQTSTTPLQDEHLASPPKRNTPPKKENPIDFLSRLISQTQNAPVKTDTRNFLDSLTMLTMVSKKPDNQHQPTGTTPQSWTAWKSKSSENNTSPSQPSSPSSYGPSGSLPTSPKQFPPVLTMAPPPIPMPVPPPIPLSIGLNMPPPPPPPPLFAHTQTLPPNISNPVLGYQQTSPGQKENWPDVQRSDTGDHTGSIRVAHSSVIKELAPADDMVAKPGPLLDLDDMDSLSGDENATPRSNDESSVESQTEFGQQLKHKPPHVSLKSHVFVPNPVRPNLMTLTVSDDLDETDMIDDDTVMEETPAWDDKSDKLGHRSRSRSRSREKNASPKHKKRKDSWNEGADSCPTLSVSDSQNSSGIGSVVKKVESHIVRNNRENNKEEKYEERVGKNEDYWRQVGRKYEHYNERGYMGRGDFRSFTSNQGSIDPVQAYAQAYKEAFFQQYNQARFNTPFLAGPPPDPRRPGYGKY